MAKKQTPPISIRFAESDEILIRQAAKAGGVSLSELIKSNFWKSFYADNKAS